MEVILFSVQVVRDPTITHALTRISNQNPRPKCTFTVRNTSVRTVNKTLQIAAACFIDGSYVSELPLPF